MLLEREVVVIVEDGELGVKVISGSGVGVRVLVNLCKFSLSGWLVAVYKGEWYLLVI